MAHSNFGLLSHDGRTVTGAGDFQESSKYWFRLFVIMAPLFCPACVRVTEAEHL